MKNFKKMVAVATLIVATLAQLTTAPAPAVQAAESVARVQSASHRHTTEHWDATCERDGSHKEYCPDCGMVFEEEEIPALGHDFEETYRREPQIGKEGKVIETCSRCGKEKVTILPPLAPTAVPTEAPTQEPTQEPTQVPTAVPTEAPTQEPTQEPTQVPTAVPTEAPTQEPTQEPTQVPTQVPTVEPTQEPTVDTPDAEETPASTSVPTEAPTKEPTAAPTEEPTVDTPDAEETPASTSVPTEAPTVEPTITPSATLTPSDSSDNVLSVYTPKKPSSQTPGKSAEDEDTTRPTGDVLGDYTPATDGVDTNSLAVKFVVSLLILAVVALLLSLLLKGSDTEGDAVTEEVVNGRKTMRKLAVMTARMVAGLSFGYHRRE